jgi:energy-converting hydrogenase Eha subunit C
MQLAARRASAIPLAAWGMVGLVVLGVVVAVATSDDLDFAIGGALIDLATMCFASQAR